MEYRKILEGLSLTNYSKKDIDDYISKLINVNVDSSCYLLLLVGPHQKAKKEFLSKLSEKINEKINQVDLKNIVTVDEQESVKKIDSLFGNLPNGSRVLFFSNTDRLCGAYTGYTYSSKRYATPQERYLLQKLKNIEKIVIFDLQDPYNADATMRRFAHHAILFDKPTSLFAKLTWKLGSVTFHGHQFENERPV